MRPIRSRDAELAVIATGARLTSGGVSGTARRRVGGRRGLTSRRRIARHAFTLVEVLVALCIFAMAVVVLGSSYLNVLISYETVARGVQVNEDFAFARQLILREPDRTKLENGGEFEATGGRRAKWSAEITSTTVPNVFNVAFTCEVSDPNRTEPEKVAQQFTVLRPTWVTDTGERDKLKSEMKTRIYELQGKKPQ
jgi:prepilin-type N-terminal cleavage/methylation domain-containing protein